MTSLAAVPAFASLDTDTITELTGYGRPARYAAGCVVRPAGTAPDAIVLLLSGTIVAAYAGPSGVALWAARWDGPAIVDKPSIFGGPPPSGALLAITPCAGLLLPRHRFLHLLDEYEQVRRHVLGRLAADALASRERLAQAATLPAAARVARWLLVAGAWHGSQQDLAHTLGLSRVTVNRALGRLARADAVRLTPGGVHVADRSRLAVHARGPD